MDARRLLLVCFLVSLGVAAATGVIALLLDLPNQEQIIVSASLVAAYSVAALACSAMLARGRQRSACWVSLGAQIVSLLGWLALIWFDDLIGWPLRDTWARVCATFTLLGASSLHVALLGLLTLKSRAGFIGRLAGYVLINGALTITVYFFWEDRLDWAEHLRATWLLILPLVVLSVVGMLLLLLWRRSWVARACFLAVFVVTYGLILLTMRWLDFDSSILWRLFGGLLIAGLFCTFASPLIAYLEHLSRKRTDDATVERFVPVRVTCPKCGASMSVRANRPESCRRCGLGIRVDITEPRCECGYLLTGITAERCPECGRAITTWDAPEVDDEPPCAG